MLYQGQSILESFYKDSGKYYAQDLHISRSFLFWSQLSFLFLATMQSSSIQTSLLIVNLKTLNVFTFWYAGKSLMCFLFLGLFYLLFFINSNSNYRIIFPLPFSQEMIFIHFVDLYMPFLFRFLAIQGRYFQWQLTIFLKQRILRSLTHYLVSHPVFHKCYLIRGIFSIED